MTEREQARADEGNCEAGVNRQSKVAEAFVQVADPFGQGVDPLVLADRLLGQCLALTAAEAAGLMMRSVRGRLRTVATSDDRAELLEILQLQNGEGPCADAWATGDLVAAPDLVVERGRWPKYADAARQAGFSSAYGVPVRVNAQDVGALNLLGAGPLSDDDLKLAQSLAGVAAVAMTVWRSSPVRSQDILTRVQSVISAKSALETAEGMVAEAGGLDVLAAARTLQAYGRRSGRGPVETAYALVGRVLDPHDVVAAVTPSDLAD
ncbi:GAF domain-containing protein [Actinacidiphila acidipaludis]|uniref:GAF domain-containing protein n=1 Tax=Actinacidiphila acidipaludis TaxID=2873382 RepID=A0ABS7QA48_9ACTN|nr:GAF domain-containing protein [Streptomyces acidipaludis]MBY8879706.1 GAF domain-containing protein [Streptomyces acidipaludis]